MHRRTAVSDGGPDSGNGAMYATRALPRHGPTRSRSPPQRRRSGLVRGATTSGDYDDGVEKRVAPVLSGSMSILFVTHARYLDHVAGARHPERPARLEAVLKGLRRADLAEATVSIEARPATRGELE